MRLSDDKTNQKLMNYESQPISVFNMQDLCFEFGRIV